MKRCHSAVSHKRAVRILKNVIKAAPEIIIERDRKVVFFSDLHRSDGSKADDSLTCSIPLNHALKHYCNEDYLGVFVGDILELLETKWKRILKFARKNPFIEKILWRINILCRFWILGNHDRKANRIRHALFSDIKFAQVLKIVDENGKLLFLCMHGHQFDIWNKGGFITQIVNLIVRYIWTPIQKRFKLSSEPETSPAKNPSKATDLEVVIIEALVELGVSAIYGHTHREKILRIDKGIYYINCGSGTKDGEVTCIEYSDGVISLKRWTQDGCRKIKSHTIAL